MATGASISFGLVDVSAKGDTTADMPDRKGFIDPQDLSLEGVYAPKVGTLEHNYMVLDGSYRMFPDNPDDYSWGVWSDSMTDETGQFTTPPMLTLTFAELHESIGLTFEFDPYGNNYCNHMNIKWYHGSSLLKDMEFFPNKWRYSCAEMVENYNKITITFFGMVHPHRYLKVQNIIHGANKEFAKGTLKSASLVEDIDLSGLTLQVNECDFTVYSDDDDFNIFNPKGIYTLLQKKQPLTIEGMQDGETMHMGTFYVDELEMESSKLLTIKAQDGVGVMDGTSFKGGLYINKNAYALIGEVMDDAGFGYTLDATLRDKTLTGYLPICTHREALQNIVFTIGGYVTTSRSGTINIIAFPDFNSMPTTTIDRNRKFTGTTVKMRKLVTGVDITAHDFKLSEETEEICKVSLSKGKNEILFSEPVSGIHASLGTIALSHVNYCIIESAEEGECTITGKRYQDTQKTISVRMEELPAGDKEEIAEADSTLLDGDNAFETAQRLFDYYQYRIEQSISFVARGEAVGQLADIETEYGVYRGSVIESMDIDLVGGFVSKVVTVGE